MTIIEVRGRGGQLIERFRSDQTEISIGRAFDNDLILEDAYVCAHHLCLTRHEHGWELHDLDSRNGLERAAEAKEAVLRSGDEVRIGHTTLHFYEAEHPTPPALPLDRREERLVGLGQEFIWTGLIAATVVVSMLGLLFESFDEWKPQTALSPITGGLLETTLVAAVWALVGRVLRHRAHFLAHLSVWLLFGLVSIVATLVAQSIAYNVGSASLEAILETGLGLAILASAIWASLTLATQLAIPRRLGAALAMAFVFVGVGVADELQFDPEFSSSPDYYDRLQAPALLWATPDHEDSLLSELPELFDRADAEAEDDED